MKLVEQKEWHRIKLASSIAFYNLSADADNITLDKYLRAIKRAYKEI